MNTANISSLVTIENFHNIGQDERGSTSQFKLSRNQTEFLFLTRKANSISGNTYHEGKNSSTNPKIFLILSGIIKISYRKIGTTDIFEDVVNTPSIITVYPLVTHKMEVLEDASIIECNSILDIQSDRIREAVESN